MLVLQLTLRSLLPTPDDYNARDTTRPDTELRDDSQNTLDGQQRIPSDPHKKRTF